MAKQRQKQQRLRRQVEARKEGWSEAQRKIEATGYSDNLRPDELACADNDYVMEDSDRGGPCSESALLDQGCADQTFGDRYHPEPDDVQFGQVPRDEQPVGQNQEEPGCSRLIQEPGEHAGSSTHRDGTNVQSEDYYSDEDASLEDLMWDRAWLELFNIKQEFSMSNACYAALRGWLRKRCRLELPSLYKLEKIVVAHCPDKLDATLVEACPAGCVLYKDEYSTCSVCPECKEERWYSDQNNTKGRRAKGFFVHYSAVKQLKSVLGDSKKVVAMKEYVQSFEKKNVNLQPGAGTRGCR